MSRQYIRNTLIIEKVEVHDLASNIDTAILAALRYGLYWQSKIACLTEDATVFNCLKIGPLHGH